MAKEKTKQTFNWRRLAIAASIIGVIAFASLLLVTNERKQHDITNISNNDKPISDTNQLKRKIELQELLADNLLPFHESKLPVLKEKSFAFATEVERVIAKIYILNDKITKLEKVLSEEGKDGKEGYGSFSFSLQNRIDSLNSLINTYTFKEGVLSVYLRAETKLKIYKVGDQYFMKFNNSINYINKNSVPTSFRKVTDIAILESIKEIDYFKPN